MPSTGTNTFFRSIILFPTAFPESYFFLKKNVDDVTGRTNSTKKVTESNQKNNEPLNKLATLTSKQTSLTLSTTQHSTENDNKYIYFSQTQQNF
jgi:hypothetical protein